MKIGLLTYHNSTNYGAVLQTYATCRALKELGHEVEIIDFRQDEKKSSRSFFFYIKVKNFWRFMDEHYPKLTEYIETIEDLKARKWDFDCLIVGSDQVWNPQIALDKLEAYFLNFGGKTVKRFSYASSFGISLWPKEKENLIPLIKNDLLQFDAISVREESGKQILKDVFEIEAKVVLDPTLLHKDYKELMGDVKHNHELINYLLYRSPKQLQIIKKLATMMGKKPRMISTIHYVKGFKYTYPPSIEAWLKYMSGADFIVTDSFHGLAFSLIFNKQFVVVSPNNGKNSRLLNLLKSVNLEHRHFFDTDEIPYEKILNEEIDYTEVNRQLDTLRENSWNYLKDALRK